MSLKHLTATPVEFIIDDVTYKMSPLTDRDIAELDEWVQSRFIRAARESLDETTPADIWERTMRLAMREALTLSWMRPPASAIFQSIDGLARLAWQSMKRNHPDLSVQNIRHLLFDPQNIDKVQEAFQRANDVGDKVVSASPATEAGRRPLHGKKSTRGSPS